MSMLIKPRGGLPASFFPQCSTSQTVFCNQRRHGSGSLLSRLLPFGKGDVDTSVSEPDPSTNTPIDQSIFDMEKSAQKKLRPGRSMRPPSYHKTSTSNFKVSRRKLNDLGRLIAGKTVDESILQMQVSEKKPSSRVLAMLTLARDHALEKGLRPKNLIIAQAWVTKGVYMRRRDPKARGRFGIMHHPSAKMNVILANGLTKEQKKQDWMRTKFRKMIRGGTEHFAGVNMTSGPPVRNTGVRSWSW